MLWISLYTNFIKDDTIPVTFWCDWEFNLYDRKENISVFFHPEHLVIGSICISIHFFTFFKSYLLHILHIFLCRRGLHFYIIKSKLDFDVNIHAFTRIFGFSCGTPTQFVHLGGLYCLPQIFAHPFKISSANGM